MRELGGPAEVDARYRHIYVEPHFDDVALSCGGQVAAQTDVLVITVFAGSPSADARLSHFAQGQHQRWRATDDAVSFRREEQRAALTLLDADWLSLPYLDAIYRGDQYLSDEDLFGSIKEADVPLAAAVAATLSSIAAGAPDARWYAPLALGNHVDHEIARRAAVEQKPLLWEDFPYAASTDVRPSGQPISIDTSAGIDTKIAAIACYGSQIPVIFRDESGPGTIHRMAEAVRRFAGYPPTERYWHPVLD